MEKILVVEDDLVINQVITEFLNENNYETVSVVNGEEAYEVFKNTSFDLILLDIMIPGIDGLSLLKKIRDISKVPVIMLTALGDDVTQLASFNQEISDYVVKPFSPLVLIKRIENALKYNYVDEQKQENIIKVNSEIYIKSDTYEVSYKENIVNLTGKEYGILLEMCKHQGKVVSREQLLVKVWGYEYFSDDRILDTHIKNIRKKLPSIPLKTIKGRGFILEDEL